MSDLLRAEIYYCQTGQSSKDCSYYSYNTSSMHDLMMRLCEMVTFFRQDCNCKIVRTRISEKCPQCKGVGVIVDTKRISRLLTCPACNGKKSFTILETLEDE